MGMRTFGRRWPNLLIVCAATSAISGWHTAAVAQRVTGIDVSAWQGNLSQANWNTIQRPTNQQVGGIFGDGKTFAFIRSSRGGTTGYYNQNDSDNSNGLNTLSQRYDDPYFVQNITRATNAGLFAGSYHFGRMDIIASTLNSNGIANTGADEADHFIQMAGAGCAPVTCFPCSILKPATVSALPPNWRNSLSISPIAYTLSKGYDPQFISAAITPAR